MNDPKNNLPPISDRSGVTDAVRIQILATEHWSLLATRSMTWNEIFSRASMFVTLLSASVVALALVAQATGFGPRFRLIALLVLPLVLLMGLATFIRVRDANTDDFGLLIGMNRLRRAYLELAPELEPFFTTGHHDDLASIQQSFGMGYQPGFNRALSATPSMVGAINMVVAGVIAALIGEALGAPDTANIITGTVVGLIVGAGHSGIALQTIANVTRGYSPRFPSE